MHWTERSTAIVRIGLELQNRGWTLFGYTEDQSDIRTDYYAPASWQGVATHPDHPGVVVCVDVSDYTVGNRKDDWPAFQTTPHGKTWHVERDGEIVRTGVGLSPCAGYGNGWEKAVSELVDRIEYAVKAPNSRQAKQSTTTTAEDYTVTIEHDRDWTWLYFSAKPPVDIRDRLKQIGARWSRKRRGWYLRRNVPHEKLAWLSN